MMTEEQYNENLALITRRNPGEVLLNTLQTGYTRVNTIYMAAAVKRLPAEEMEAPDLKGHTPYADETLWGLWRERTKLFGEMHKQSNLFHQCQTDNQRAENSKKVLGWWKSILAVKAKIEYYEHHGEMPPAEDGAEPMPDNPVALGKKLNSIRARISQKKQQLEALAGLDEGTPEKQSKIDAAEADLRTLKYMAGLAQEKLKTYEQEA